MNINKYTEKAREAVAGAIERARAANNPQLEPEHLLVALVEQRDGIVPNLLRKMNADPAAVARTARELLKKLPAAYGGAEPGMSPRLTLVTDQAQAEADRLKDEFVSTEHLFIALADEGGRSPSAQLLKQNGIARDAILQALTTVRGSHPHDPHDLPGPGVPSTIVGPSTSLTLRRVRHGSKPPAGNAATLGMRLAPGLVGLVGSA